MGLYFWVKDLLSRPALGWVSRLGLGPLAAAAWAYGRVQAARRWAYRRGLVPSWRAGAPVISVGNILVGGTGKTPCVEAVCRMLQDAGRRPAVISRGYGGRFDGPWAAVSDGDRVLMSPADAGDEPVLLADRLPGVPVLVGRDRRRPAREAVDRYGADVLVLDDGFQHLRLRRDLDVVTVDVRNPLGNGHCLPRGLLREGPSALADADVVLLTRTRGVAPDRIASVRRDLARYAPEAPILCTGHVPVGLVDLATGEQRPLDELVGRKVLAFAGIGYPGPFFREVEALGARVLEAVPFPDHHPYTRADLDQLERWSGLMNAQILVTTEKDAVRLRPLLPLRLPVLALRIAFQVDGDPTPLRDRVLGALARPGASGA